MNSTIKGNALEDLIFKYFKDLIESGNFFGGMRSCKIFQKKGYYSRDRETEIIFDVSIEAYFPGAENYSFLFLIECKNYDHPVPVSDVEEFFTKAQQVGSANSKAILISTNSFQSGGLTFAKSKGMGIARYYDPSELKWQLYRSSSSGLNGQHTNTSHNIVAALNQESHKSAVFDFHLQTARRYTNSIELFFEDLCADLNTQVFSYVFCKQQPCLVPFLDKGELELLAAKSLEYIEYERGQVDLQKLILQHPAMTGLQVKHTALASPKNSSMALGRIEFDPLTIEIFTYPDRNIGRERFTFAHEIAHLLLGHGKYMRGEYTEEVDFQSRRPPSQGESDITRMEYQANHFAASLLMPRKSFTEHFMSSLKFLELHDKGFGPLFVDAQECNVRNYLAVTSALMLLYGTSRMAVTIRAEALGLLRDDRNLLPGRAGLPLSEDSLRWFQKEVE